MTCSRPRRSKASRSRSRISGSKKKKPERAMAKTTTQFSCQACGSVFPKWVGRCTSCGAWNTLVEEVTQKRAGASPAARASAALPVGAIDADQAARIPTGIGELDRVLGGGVVLGGVTLL